MRKHFIFLILLLISCELSYASGTKINGIWYNLDSSKKTASVTYRGDYYRNYPDEYHGNVIIPSSIVYDGKTYTVTSIGDYAFYLSPLTSITIPNSVTSIGLEAFAGCASLTSIDLPKSITEINTYVFNSCTSLTSICIPENVTVIGSDLFLNCSSLTSITWNVKGLAHDIEEGYRPFRSIGKQITSFTFGENVERIPSCLCFGMSQLTSITIPKNVTIVGHRAFEGCSDLTSIVWNAQRGSDCSSSIDPFKNIRNQITSFTFGEEVDIIPIGLCSNMTNLTSITIPNRASTIRKDAFSGCSSLTSVTIGNSVTGIGDAAFEYCSSLASVTIGNSVTSIGDYAFSGCSSLASVTIPNSVTSIGDAAFEYCSSLASVTIGNNVTSIGNRAFSGCSMTSVIIGNSVTSIGSYAFRCSSLTSITIPNSVTSIGKEAFSNTSIASITLTAPSIENFCQGNGNLLLYNQGVNCERKIQINGAEKTNIIIPESISSLGEKAFYNCATIGSITIPNTLSIGTDAFTGCSSVTSITLTAPSIEEFCQGQGNKLLCDQGLYCDRKIQINGSDVKDIIIPNDVLSIGDYTFYRCASLNSITIGNGVNDIGFIAFYGCSLLKSLTLGNNVTTIGESAFGDCSSLPSIILPQSVTTIGRSAFSGCSSLTSITIPTNVTSIDASAFSRCSSLTSVTWNAKNCSNYATPFYGIRSQITSFVLGDSVTYIPDLLCDEMVNLSSITIPNGVTTIGKTAFCTCTSLSSINIPNSVTSIGDMAFNNCSSLVSVTLGNGITSIGNNVFENCSSLTSIKIPNQVTYIGNSAFNNCSSLTSINIPNNVMGIGAMAFDGCISLTSIEWNTKNDIYYYSEANTPFYSLNKQITSFTFGDSVKYIPNYLCNGMENITSITIPKNVVSIGNNVFTNCSSLKSITWDAKNYADFSSADKTPFYGIKSQITSFALGVDVENIPAYLCDGMDKISSLMIPNSVTTIGQNAFNGCSSLTSLDIPNNVQTIGENAFRDCSSIKSISVGKNIASIGNNAFTSCTSLESVTWNAKHCADFGEFYSDYIDGQLYQFFWGAPFSSNVSIKLGNEVEHIPGCLFLYMENLTSITIPNSVTSIGSGAFYGCTALTSVNIPKNVKDIDFLAFAGCPSRTSITVANGNSTYDSRNNCNAIIEKTTNTLIAGCKNTTIPNDVLHIDDYAFYGGGSSFTSMTIPASVETIGEFAFGECPRLYDIYCYAAVPPIAKQSSFSNYNAFVHVPCESQRYYVLDGIWNKFKNYECITSDNVTTDGVYTTPSTNDVTIIWPIETGADSYVIVIMKETEVVCTLTFNADGQLLNIAFAPSRDGSRPAQHTQYAEQTTDGYRFTVTGLEAATHYTYDITVKDIANNTIKTHSGEFTTQSNAPTPVDNIPSSTINCQKIFRDGQLLILRDGKTYNVMGQEL